MKLQISTGYFGAFGRIVLLEPVSKLILRGRDAGGGNESLWNKGMGINFRPFVALQTVFETGSGESKPACLKMYRILVAYPYPYGFHFFNQVFEFSMRFEKYRLFESAGVS